MKKGYNKSKTSSSKGYAMDVPEMKPTLSLGSDDLKEVKSWDVGKTYDLEVTVKMISKHLGSDGETNGMFEVQDVSVDNDADEGTGDGGN